MFFSNLIKYPFKKNEFLKRTLKISSMPSSSKQTSDECFAWEIFLPLLKQLRTLKILWKCFATVNRIFFSLNGMRLAGAK